MSLREYVENGYKIGPNYQQPCAVVSDEWIDSNDPLIHSLPDDYSDWWKVFNDPILNSLIQTAYDQNLSLRVAGLRIVEARALQGIAVGNFFPQVQEAFGDYRHIELSDQFRNNRFADTHFSEWILGGNLAWELDFWGRFRRGIESADARLDASINDYDDVLVLLLADVASTYVEIRTFQQRLKYAHSNVVIQKESARVADVKLRAGALGSELGSPQANTILAQTKSIIPELEIGLRQATNRLSVLLGTPPRNLSDLLEGTKPIPTGPAEVAVGIPAELLHRRPDVRRAERDIAAQSAEIGIAETDLYPQITINGTLFLDANQFADLFDQRAWAGNVGPSFRWNILNYGRIINNIRAQNARFDQLVVEYENTVLKANEEAENAIVAFLRSQQRVKVLLEGNLHATKAVEVANIKYEDGEIPFNLLAVPLRQLVQLQDSLAASQGDVANSLIQLYKALGGGWEIRLQDQTGTYPIEEIQQDEVPMVPPVPASDPESPGKEQPHLSAVPAGEQARRIEQKTGSWRPHRP